MSDLAPVEGDSALPAPDFLTRLWFAWVCYFRIVFDRSFAARAWAVREKMPELERPALEPAPKPKAKEKVEEAPPAPKVDEEQLDEARRAGRAEGRAEGALTLLSLLQADGRLVDFLQQDVTTFDDADVGAAARVVHEGCKKALASRVVLEAILKDKEGSSVTLEEGFDRRSVKLTGNVPADAQTVRGKLQHKGWRATSVKLPEPTKGHVAEVVCPAEVEV